MSFTFMPKTNAVATWFAECGQTLTDQYSFRHQIEVVSKEFAEVSEFRAQCSTAGLHAEAFEAATSLDAANMLLAQMRKRLNDLTK